MTEFKPWPYQRFDFAKGEVKTFVVTMPIIPQPTPLLDKLTKGKPAQ